jgi:hypothetical protein
MSQQDTFELNSVFDLKPVYISLGLPKSTFGVGEEKPARGPFDTAMDGGNEYPDSVWFFRGENCYRFSKQGEYEDGPKRMSEVWGGASWPHAFDSGIDAALWGGPDYPDAFYFFKDNLYVWYNVKTQQVSIAPRAIALDWPAAPGNWLADGPGAALHAIETKYRQMTHFFKGSEYIRTKQNIGPIPITQQYHLPEPFAHGIDLTFYGSGDESQKVYFFKGDQCLLYDLKRDQTERVLPIEERFPAMAKYIPHPQLFLVENYQLVTYAGPSKAGRLVQTVSILGRSKLSVILVTEVTETSSTAIHQTLLQSQDDAVVKNFDDQMKTQNEQSGSHEKYDYHLDASFHGDASATSLTGGEVNANLKAQGGTNDVRDSFAKAASRTIQSQINTTSSQVTQQVYSGDQKYERTSRTLRTEEQTIDNTSSDKKLVYEYHEQLQMYLTLLVLCEEHIAFVDGHTPPTMVNINQMDSLLSKHIPKQQDRDDVRQLIIGELMTIDDYQGTPTTVLKEVSLPTPSNGQPGVKVYQFDPILKSTYTPVGTQQAIVANGLVKSGQTWIVPTDTLIPIERS